MALNQSTDDLRDLCDGYLVKLSKGEVNEADQPVAAALLGDRIRRLENTVKAHAQRSE